MKDKLDKKYLPSPLTFLRTTVSSIPFAGGALEHLIFDKMDQNNNYRINEKIKHIELNIGASYEYKQIIESNENKIFLPIKKNIQLNI